jgi:hypothetical protein
MASSQNCDFRLRTLAATLALPLTVGSSYAAAQQAILEEVIVTAQKRSESVQDIPSTVNVIDGEALKEFNVFNFTDLGALSAGLEINSFNGRSGRINLRGIDYNPNSASEASVTTSWIPTRCSSKCSISSALRCCVAHRAAWPGVPRLPVRLTSIPLAQTWMKWKVRLGERLPTMTA